jgi:hypothetical protein
MIVRKKIEAQSIKKTGFCKTRDITERSISWSVIAKGRKGTIDQENIRKEVIAIKAVKRQIFINLIV